MSVERVGTMCSDSLLLANWGVFIQRAVLSWFGLHQVIE